jgi:hypothetical protein
MDLLYIKTQLFFASPQRQNKAQEAYHTGNGTWADVAANKITIYYRHATSSSNKGFKSEKRELKPNVFDLVSHVRTIMLEKFNENP